jgi:hypothetical protein
MGYKLRKVPVGRARMLPGQAYEASDMLNINDTSMRLWETY